MNSKYSFSLLCLSLLALSRIQAQTVDDALVFSREDNGTSARIKALGNAQTALGGDISSINGNPAGLGFFSRSDISITFNQLQNTNKANYFGNNTTSKKGNFGVDQAGVVFNFPVRSYSGWQNFNVGVSYNKTQNFNNSRHYEGTNGESSYVRALTDIMLSDPDFEQDLYLNSNIVEKYENTNLGYFPLAVETGNKDQYNSQIVKGNRSKTALSFGANYINKFYIGATIGLTSFKYEKHTEFIENGWTKTDEKVAIDNPNSIFIDPDNLEHDYLDASYELFDNFKQFTEGSGVDLKVGMIYKPAVDWNIGLTINTPTWITIKDDTEAYTDVNFYEDKTSDHPFPDDMQYMSDLYESGMDYMLTTPWKFAFGVSKFFSRGLITTDVEVIDHRQMRYSDLTSSYYANNQYKTVNDAIKDIYQTAVNFRIGGEYLFTNMLSGRAGFSYYGNPYKNADDKNLSGSLGLGIKVTNALYVDLAVNQHINSYSEAPYVLNNLTSPVVKIDHNRTNVAFTIGAKF